MAAGWNGEPCVPVTEARRPRDCCRRGHSSAALGGWRSELSLSFKCPREETTLGTGPATSLQATPEGSSDTREQTRPTASVGVTGRHAVPTPGSSGVGCSTAGDARRLAVRVSPRRLGALRGWDRGSVTSLHPGLSTGPGAEQACGEVCPATMPLCGSSCPDEGPC